MAKTINSARNPPSSIRPNRSCCRFMVPVRSPARLFGLLIYPTCLIRKQCVVATVFDVLQREDVARRVGIQTQLKSGRHLGQTLQLRQLMVLACLLGQRSFLGVYGLGQEESLTSAGTVGLSLSRIMETRDRRVDQLCPGHPG